MNPQQFAEHGMHWHIAGKSAGAPDRHSDASRKRLIRAMTIRKEADTMVPINPPASRRTEKLFCAVPAASAISRVSANTTVECPSEKKNPADSGRLPSCINLCRTLSMAAM